MHKNLGSQKKKHLRQDWEYRGKSGRGSKKLPEEGDSRVENRVIPSFFFFSNSNLLFIETPISQILPELFALR